MDGNMTDRKPKILIIEDNPVDREVATGVLEEHGFDVVTLVSAVNCLETIVSEKPDLLLLDVMMPELNGNEALTIIREKFSSIELPIIMVTAKSDASDVVVSLKNGANDYITKPIQFEVAFRRIHTHLSLALQAQAMAQAKELAAIHAMIATFNHEINNPLSAACINLDLLKGESDTNPRLLKIEDALWRIADIVKKISLVLEKSSVEYEKYGSHLKIIKLKS